MGRLVALSSPYMNTFVVVYIHYLWEICVNQSLFLFGGDMGYILWKSHHWRVVAKASIFYQEKTTVILLARDFRCYRWRRFQDFQGLRAIVVTRLHPSLSWDSSHLFFFGCTPLKLNSFITVLTTLAAASLPGVPRFYTREVNSLLHQLQYCGQLARSIVLRHYGCSVAFEFDPRHFSHGLPAS